MAKYWTKRYQYITNCSIESPYVRQLKGKTISFTEPRKLKEFLETSSEAAFMWADCEDLAIISDMYQINIKIITRNRAGNINVTENWIYPDPELKDFAELRDVNLGDMILLHEDDNHFSLIISKDK